MTPALLSGLIIFMIRQIDSRLDEVKKIILTMGGHVERAVEEATQALIERDIERFMRVHELEAHINSEQIQIDEACFELLAQQSPVAKDLRLILSIIKINTDLERMGDQAVNIAHTGKDYLTKNFNLKLDDILTMSKLVRNMVQKALDSFVRMDADSAKEILELDDEVDGYKRKISREIKHWMMQNAPLVEAGLDIIMIAKNLERLGDHATNIAEDVIFATTGNDIRHGGGI